MTFETVAKLIQETLDPAVTAEWVKEKSTAWSGGSILKDIDGVLSGYIIGEIRSDAAHILKIGVTEKARRKGVAADLLGNFEQAARSANLKSLTLEVKKSNAAAVAFYRKYGFSDVGLYIYPDGAPGIRMMKRLDLQKGRAPPPVVFKWHGEAGITKYDSESGIVEGIASHEMVDRHGDLIDLAAFQASAQAYTEIGGPIMLVHYPVPVGRLVEPPMFTEKEVRLKAWITDKTLSGQEARSGLESGKYKGFSIGGEVRAQHRECGVKAATCYNRITAIDWFETSLVETPANPRALIESFTKGLAEAGCDGGSKAPPVEVDIIILQSPTVAEGPHQCECGSLSDAQKAEAKDFLAKMKARDAVGGAPQEKKTESPTMSKEEFEALTKAQAETNTLLKSLVEKMAAPVTLPAPVAPAPATPPAKTEAETLKEELAKRDTEIADLKKKAEIGSRGSHTVPATGKLGFELRKSLEEEAANPKTSSKRRTDVFRQLGVPEAELHPGPTRKGVA